MLRQIYVMRLYATKKGIISKDNWTDATLPLKVIRESVTKPTMQDMEKFIEETLSMDADKYTISISVDEMFVN